MIRAHDISLTFREQVIFDHLAFALQKDAKVGLVGRNGSGKSTLLKVLAQQHILDEGYIETSSGFKIAYMPQEVLFNSTKNVYDEAFETFAHIVEAQRECAEIEKLFEDASKEVTAEILSHYSSLQEQLANSNIAEAQTKTLSVLKGLGFGQEQLQEKVAALSVGWKMRLVLAKLLLQEADFYLFDEPTNHLDIFAKEWFLQFLKGSQSGFLLVCHERYFLDQLCNNILDLEQGKGRFYTGNYSAFQVQKEQQKEQLASAYARQQKELDRKKATIERFRASATKAKMAQSMIKSLDKIEVIEMERETKTMRFSFKDLKPSGREVLAVSQLGQAFDQKQIFNNVSFSIERGEKIAVIAANGVGKTTLFNTITGKYTPKSGSIKFGYNVESAIFDQDQNAVLDLNKTIYQEIEDSVPGQSTQAIRSTLGAFLFSNNDVTKKIGVLSGGERGRVSLVRVLLRNANFMLLDEPTNHLDIQSKDVLLQALKDYTGTLLFVSHDYDFINQLSTRVLELTPTGVHNYIGNYQAYIDQKNAALGIIHKAQQAAPEKTQKVDKPAKQESERVAQVQRSNKELYEWKKAGNRIQEKLKRIEKEMLETDAQSFERLSELEKKYKVTTAELEAHEKSF